MRQLSPGIYMPTAPKNKGGSRILKPMPECPFCGAANCMQHPKYTTMCYDCGKRYSLFMNNRHYLKTGYSAKRDESLHECCNEYVRLLNAGHHVPQTVKKYLEEHGYRRA